MSKHQIAPTSSHHANPQPKALRVLCADDHEQLALVVKYAFERAGHHVECVSDGLSALERVMEDLNFFNVLVTDHQMPRLSGLGLVSKLRDTEFSGAIVVHSSHLTKAEADAYRALAVDHILGKPAPLPMLLGIIHALVEAPP
ncbi:MAG TPA: response regulator [Candidatus Paceibacterota bacterium]|nr:response regulator [Candidatus Paceibacterota bacterium]